MTAQILQFPQRTPERLLKLPEICETFGYSERWFRYRIAEGMPVKRYGKRLRFSSQEVEAWLDKRYMEERT